MFVRPKRQQIQKRARKSHTSTASATSLQTRQVHARAQSVPNLSTQPLQTRATPPLPSPPPYTESPIYHDLRGPGATSQVNHSGHRVAVPLSAPPSYVSQPTVSSTCRIASHAEPPPTDISFQQQDEDRNHDWPDRAESHLDRLISSKLDAVLTSIDGEAFSGDERELFIYAEPPLLRGGWGSAARGVARAADRGITSAIVSTNYFAKANLYSNSRLPANLPPLKLFLPSYPLICLAAQYSQRAYVKAAGKERDSYVNADWRLGTKAMVIKSVPIDDMNVVVFAIRGSQTFMDWAVNLRSAPVPPEGFLDDPGNLCHSGFLSVARKMIRPVAARLRALLEEDPSRSSCSLLITGHSAGGAVASLLYAHMLAETATSELNILRDCFKRVHCLTFGTPPVSLLPLNKPETERYKKSLFLSFINEGDPVPRADKAYVRSLLDLYAAPTPKVEPSPAPIPTTTPCRLATSLVPFVRPKPNRSNSAPVVPTPTPQWIWRVPPGTLSNAGRLIVLRTNFHADSNSTGAPDTAEDDIKAEVTCDQELRGVVFGDPVMHMMKVYARRVEVLATRAVTARIFD